MAEKKNFLGWVGFTGDDNNSNTPSTSSVDRIRELEAQIADLKSRRDITGLTREEFEILATETAMSMIKSAQARESKAQAAARITGQKIHSGSRSRSRRKGCRSRD
ncbi:MAG: hypothetical protein LW691_03665 [Streptomycetaceae bacterium]|nr:hypothetical protein [Streptomycetaceae bacterium]